jgi:hypothetical protein
MAFKKYAYYNKGNRVAVVESETGSAGGNTAVAHCTIGTHTNKADCEAAGGTWIPSSSGISAGNWEKYISPKESITDGIELEYSYAPKYRINDDSDTVAITGYDESGTGLLKILSSSAFPTSGITHIVIGGSEKWNGIHEIDTFTSSSAMILKTKYNGGTVTEASTMYKDVSALVDESYELDLTSYQAQAVVYYLKAKMSEEMKDMEGREYFMRLFKKQMEKASSARKRGPYMVKGFWGMTNG